VFRRNLAVLTLILGVGVLTTPLLVGQTGSATPKFEVASIKRCAPSGGGVFPVPPAPGRITLNCRSVMSLIRQSFALFANGRMDLSPVNIIPPAKDVSWIDSDLYTIEAKAESNPDHTVLGQGMMLGPMMQALLEDRLKVKVHREIRQVPVYSLTLGKGGPKLQPAREDGCVVQDLDQLPAPPVPGQAPRPFCGFALVMNNGFEMRGATMAQLCRALSGTTGRKVVDRTGISGVFDIRLDWSGGDLTSAPAPPPPPPGSLPLPGPDPAAITAGIQSALQKFGLRLVPTQGPGDFLVIDHVERPSEN
jgi:uncharacterized protein (TIGR03435 family)